MRQFFILLWYIQCFCTWGFQWFEVLLSQYVVLHVVITVLWWGEGCSEIWSVWKWFLIGNWWLDCCIVIVVVPDKKHVFDVMLSWLTALNFSNFIACYRIVLYWLAFWSFKLPLRFFTWQLWDWWKPIQFLIFRLLMRKEEGAFMAHLRVAFLPDITILLDQKKVERSVLFILV